MNTIRSKISLIQIRLVRIDVIQARDVHVSVISHVKIYVHQWVLCVSWCVEGSYVIICAYLGFNQSLHLRTLRFWTERKLVLYLTFSFQPKIQVLNMYKIYSTKNLEYRDFLQQWTWLLHISPMGLCLFIVDEWQNLVIISKMLFQIRVGKVKKSTYLNLSTTLQYVLCTQFWTTSAQWRSNLGQVHNLRSQHAKGKWAPSSFISHNLEAD
jgi:hypothetical protein